MKSRAIKAFWIFLIFSALIHFGGFLGINFLASTPRHYEPAIEVDILTDDAQKNGKFKEEPLRQIVDQDKPINDEKTDKAKYLSAFNQKVNKETISKNRGNFRNGPNAVGDGDSGSPKVGMEKFKPDFNLSKMVRDRLAQDQEVEKQLEEDAIKRFEEKQKQAASPPVGSQRPGQNGPKASQTLDYIKDLDPGLETLLSTREFVYFSYYKRIREQLNQHWTPMVREKLGQIFKQGRNIASSDDKITKCLITLDPRGKLIRVQIIGISGVRELDEAAVDAFKAAAPFPNPPKGMVDDDGTIKIRWDFILEA